MLDFEILKQLGVILGSVGTGGYVVWRKVKGDLRNDGVDDKTQTLIGNLESQLSREVEEKHKLSAVIDRIAGERNEAVSKVGELNGIVHALQKEVARMSGELEEVEQRNKELTDSMLKMTETMQQFSAQMQELQSSNAKLVDAFQLDKKTVTDSRQKLINR